MRMLITLLSLLMLTGFTTCQRRSDAPIADADAQCYRQYMASAEDTGVRWDADPADPGAWDALAGTAFPELVRRALGTEASRQSCVDFIRSLQKRGVIRSKQ